MTRPTFKDLLEHVHKYIKKGKSMYVRNHRGGAELHITLISGEDNKLLFDWFPKAKARVFMCFYSNRIDKSGNEDWINHVHFTTQVDLEDTDWYLVDTPEQHV